MTALPRRVDRLLAPVVSAVATFLVLGPVLLHRGFALVGDMVFVPDQPWKPAWLGLDGSVPRSVPMDAVVWLLDQLLPGDLVQKLLLAGSLMLAGLGISALVRGAGRLATAAAIVLFVWNPWVAERLAIGQWPCLTAYALLPWLVLAAVRLRDGRRRGWSGTAGLLVLSAVCAPSLGLLAVVVALAVVLSRPTWRTVAVTLVTAVVANLPWLLPALLRPAITATASQFSDFAARGESPLGVVASVLSLGGIWKAADVPAERTHVAVVGVSLVLTLAAPLGLRAAARWLGRRTVVGLGAVAAAAVLCAVLPAVGPIGDWLGRRSTDLPALGLVRDSDRYLGPLGVLLAVGAAGAVDALVRRAGAGLPALRVAAAAVVVLPVVLLPSLAWGSNGWLRPVPYPAQWDQVAARLAAARASGQSGAVVVLPWTGSYRGFAWNDWRAQLDPAPRFLPGDVLIDDRTFLGPDQVVGGEDPYLSEVGSALQDGPDDAAGAAARLRALGVRWLLAEGSISPDQEALGSVVSSGPWLTLVDLGPAAPSPRSRPPAAPIIAGDALAAALLIPNFVVTFVLWVTPSGRICVTCSTSPGAVRRWGGKRSDQPGDRSCPGCRRGDRRRRRRRGRLPRQPARGA